MIPRRRACTHYRLREHAPAAIVAQMCRVAARPAAWIFGAGSALVLAYAAGFIAGHEGARVQVAIATDRAAIAAAQAAELGAMLRRAILRDGAYTLHLSADSLSALGTYAERAAVAIKRDATGGDFPLAQNQSE